MNDKVLDGLKICFKTTHMIKDQYPNEIMKIQNDTIIPYEKNSRKCRRKSMSNTYAYYTHKTPHRIIIKQKYLSDPIILRTKIKSRFDRTMLYGNFALIELMCHELAHHRTKGHAKGFKIKYYKFLHFMVNKIISGEYYQSFPETKDLY